MRILAISDEESSALWEHYQPGRLQEYDLILSCGDLKPDYLSFLVTMGRCPLLYVHGNHDASYAQNPPEGCDCIEDKLVVYNGIRILGLGGCRKYHPGPHQHTEREMRRRIRRLRYLLWRNKGVDIVLTHAPAQGLGDSDDPAHQGFAALRELLDKYHPAYLVHGHVHLRYNRELSRTLSYGDTTIINAYERYAFDIAEREHSALSHNILQWKNGAPQQDN